MYEFYEQPISEETGIDALETPGVFIKGASYLEYNGWLSEVCWDCMSGVLVILNEDQANKLYDEYKTTVDSEIKKLLAFDESEDCSTLLIYKCGESYLALIIYMYDDSYPIKLVGSTIEDQAEDYYVYVGGDADDKSIIEILSETDVFEQDEDPSDSDKWITKLMSKDEMEPAIWNMRELILPVIRDMIGWEDQVGYMENSTL